MDQDFLKYQPGASFVVASPDDAKGRVFILHGVGSSASKISGSSKILARLIPEFEIVSINGFYPMKEDIVRHYEKLSDDEPTPPSFSWFQSQNTEPKPSQEPEEESLKLIVDKYQIERTLPVGLLGFSQGGFLSAGYALRYPETLKTVFLHSSGLLGKPNQKQIHNLSPNPL